jgi:gag-polypeptide of LTR copia-type
MIMVDLGKKLQSIKCGDNEDVHAHFTKLNDLHEQLLAMGKILGDDEYASILLRSLPTSYEPTTSAINAATDLSSTDITPDIVTRLVTDEYDQRVIKKGMGKNGPEEAFSADGRKRD